MHTDLFGEKLLEGGLWLSGSAMLVRLIGLGVTLALVTLLSLEEYGTYKLVVATFGFLAAFFVSGFDALVVNDLALEKKQGRFGRVKKLFLEYSALKLFIGCGLFIVTLFGSMFFAGFYPADLLLFFPIISFLFIFMALERGLNILLNLNMEFRLLSLFTVIEEVTKLLLILIFIGMFKQGARGAVMADVLSTGVALTFFIPHGVVLFRRALAEQAAKGSVLWEMVRSHGKWAIASRYLGEAKNSIRPWLIQVFAGREAVALWAFAESLYSQIVSLFPLTNVLAPILPQEIGNRERIKTLLFRGIKYGTPLFLALGAVAYFLLPVLVEIFLPRYNDSLPLFSIILVTMVTSATALLLTSILYAHREQRLQFLVNVLITAFMVGMGAFLLRIFGIVGVAYEFVLSTVIYNAIRLWYILRTYPELKFSMRELFIWDAGDWDFLRSIFGQIRWIRK